MIFANLCRRMRPCITFRLANGAPRASTDQFYYAVCSETFVTLARSAWPDPLLRQLGHVLVSRPRRESPKLAG